MYEKLICPNCNFEEPWRETSTDKSGFVSVALPTSEPYQGMLMLKICLSCGHISTRFPITIEDRQERFLG